MYIAANTSLRAKPKKNGVIGRIRNLVECGKESQEVD